MQAVGQRDSTTCECPQQCYHQAEDELWGNHRGGTTTPRTSRARPMGHPREPRRPTTGAEVLYRQTNRTCLDRQVLNFSALSTARRKKSRPCNPATLFCGPGCGSLAATVCVEPLSSYPDVRLHRRTSHTLSSPTFGSFAFAIFGTLGLEILLILDSR